MPADDARVRLGELLIRRRVEINPAWRNRTLFAKETDVGYFTVLDIERAKPKSLNFEQSTIANLERAYRLAPGAISKFLEAGGDLAIQDGQPAQALPPEDGESPAEKLTLAELRRQAAELLDTIDAKLAELEGPPQANGGERRSA